MSAAPATVLYGAVVAAGGVMGFAKAGSIASLAAGGGSGTVLILMGALAWNQQLQGKRSSPAFFQVSLAVAAVLVAAMGARFMKSKKFMPAGLVAGLSAAMCIYYLRVLNGKVFKGVQEL